MWEENDNFVIYVSAEFKSFANLAIFSFEGTLVEKIGTNNEIVLFSRNVITELKNISVFGSIVVIENRFTRKDTVKKNIIDFLKLLPDIPLMLIFILHANRYMKPLTNIMEVIEKKMSVDMTKSIVIGNNAGRFRTNKYDADYNDYDRAFANNLGITTFRTPEQFFNNSTKSRKWQWKMTHISNLLTDEKEPSLTFLLKSKNPVIFITGPLCSGKSSLAIRIAHILRGIKIIDIDKKLNISDKLADYKEGVIIVDILYNETLSTYQNLIEKSSSIFIIDIYTNLATCLFLNKFKLQLTKNDKLVAHSATDIGKWFTTDKLFQNSDWYNSYGITYVKFPLELRTRTESFYRY